MGKFNSISVLFQPGETTYVTPQVYTHNKGQIIDIYGLPYDDQTVKMSFAKDGEDEAIPAIAAVTNGQMHIGLPDGVLTGMCSCGWTCKQYRKSP